MAISNQNPLLAQVAEKILASNFVTGAAPDDRYTFKLVSAVAGAGDSTTTLADLTVIDTNDIQATYTKRTVAAGSYELIVNLALVYTDTETIETATHLALVYDNSELIILHTLVSSIVLDTTDSTLYSESFVLSVTG